MTSPLQTIFQQYACRTPVRHCSFCSCCNPIIFYISFKLIFVLYILMYTSAKKIIYLDFLRKKILEQCAICLPVSCCYCKMHLKLMQNIVRPTTLGLPQEQHWMAIASAHARQIIISQNVYSSLNWMKDSSMDLLSPYRATAC